VLHRERDGKGWGKLLRALLGAGGEWCGWLGAPEWGPAPEAVAVRLALCASLWGASCRNGVAQVVAAWGQLSLRCGWVLAHVYLGPYVCLSWTACPSWTAYLSVLDRMSILDRMSVCLGPASGGGPQVLGCAMVKPLDRDEDGVLVAELGAFCVDPSFRGTGRGDSLFDFAGVCCLPGHALLRPPACPLIPTIAGRALCGKNGAAR
jgi:hypothetical protein